MAVSELDKMIWVGRKDDKSDRAEHLIFSCRSTDSMILNKSRSWKKDLFYLLVLIPFGLRFVLKVVAVADEKERDCSSSTRNVLI